MRSGLLLLLLVAFALAKTEKEKKAEEEAKESNAVDDADGDHNENENENGGEKSKREASPNPPKTDFSNGEFFEPRTTQNYIYSMVYVFIIPQFIDHSSQINSFSIFRLRHRHQLG